MNTQDKEIVNLIIKSHIKQFKLKRSDYVIYVLPFVLISVCGMVVYGFDPLWKDGFIKYYFYSVLAIVGFGLIYVMIAEERKSIKRKWMLQDLNENDFKLLADCSNELKIKIKEEMAPNGSLMYISLEKIYRAECESQENESQRQKIETILK